MERVIINSPGGFDKIKFESFTTPKINDNEVLVKTRAIGVNYADCLVRMGYYSSAKKYVGWPITPGFEFSGIIEAKGDKVDDMQVGQKVYGISRFSSYSSHVMVPSDQVFLLPNNLSLEEAGGFPIIYLTAYYALHMTVHIFSGSTILIHSASGGVGSALLQLSKLAGWETIGVVGSSHKIKASEEMGADYIIDKSKEDLWRMVDKYAPGGLDVVLDGNGAQTLRAGFKRLKPTGKMISYGFHTMFPKGKGNANPMKLIIDYIRTPKFHPIKIKNKSLVTFNLSFLFDRKDLLRSAMQQLILWMEDDKIKLPKITTYPFNEVAQAHKDLQSGETVGKLVLIND